jgi:hypothetical protein
MRPFEPISAFRRRSDAYRYTTRIGTQCASQFVERAHSLVMCSTPVTLAIGPRGEDSISEFFAFS